MLELGLTGGPDVLLAAVATVCIVGSVVAAVRAVVTYRTSSTDRI